MLKNRRLNLSREPTYRTLLQLQEPKYSYTVVIRPQGYTAHGLGLLEKVAQASSRHRFVLVVEKRSWCSGVIEACEKLQKIRNIFIGFVGIEGKRPSFDSVGGAYAELIERATPNTKMAS